MARTDRDAEVSGRRERARSAAAALPRAWVIQVAAGVAVVMLGLAAVGSAGWAVDAARQTMQGRMAVYARYTRRVSMVHVGLIEIAENTP